MSKEHENSQTGKIEYLKVDDLSRDPEINVRPIDQARAKRYAADFDIDALGIITVSRRADNKNIILDGQHRCEALRLMGWNGEKIPCKVFAGLTRQQEAMKFINLNTQVAIGFLNKFLARLTAKEKVALAIVEICRANGFMVDRFPRDGVIVAAKALEDIYLGKNQKIRGMNPKALHGTLSSIAEAWDRTPKSANNSVLLGIGAFLLRYGESVNLGLLITKMRGISGGPQGLINRGRGKRELHGGSLASGIAHYLTDEYNNGLRGKSKLTPWRE
jgi:hypothetical protein